MLLGVRTEGESESGVRGVEGAVALWERLIGGGALGIVAGAKDTLDTRFTCAHTKTEKVCISKQNRRCLRKG